MLRALVLAVSFLVAALPASAEEGCDQPYAPDIKPSPTLSKSDLVAMRGDVQAFIEASDIYQDCLSRVAVRNPSFAGRAEELKHQNQSDKELVGKRINDLITAYNASLESNKKYSEASR